MDGPSNPVSSPSGTFLVTPSEEKPSKIRLKRELGLLEGVAIILGIIFGSGIFISPQGILSEVKSVGGSIVIWMLCGFLSLIGALCYAELGTSIPKSGGDYAYIFEAFGPLPAFLYLWAAMIIFVPTTNAIMGLTFAKHILQPFFSNCNQPEMAIRLISAAVICFFTFINCYDVRGTTKVQNAFMFTKIAALGLIIVMGIIVLFTEGTENFNNAFADTDYNAGKIAVAFYSGIFSFSGWNYLNFMTEELKNPYVNLPRAIYLSLPLVTLVYVFANVAYLVVLSPSEMLASEAMAVTFAEKSMGMFSWLMPILVSLSALGGLSVHIMTSARMFFVGARYGHFPAVLSHVNMYRFTPANSLIFLCILSLLMLYTVDIFSLITYSSFVESFFITMSVLGLLYLRFKEPNKTRPIKVNLVIPISFVVMCIFLLVLPMFAKPWEVFWGVVITASGIPVFIVGVMWKNKPEWFNKAFNGVTHFVQKVFLSAKEEQTDWGEET